MSDQKSAPKPAPVPLGSPNYKNPFGPYGPADLGRPFGNVTVIPDKK